MRMQMSRRAGTAEKGEGVARVERGRGGKLVESHRARQTVAAQAASPI